MRPIAENKAVELQHDLSGLSAQLKGFQLPQCCSRLPTAQLQVDVHEKRISVASIIRSRFRKRFRLRETLSLQLCCPQQSPTSPAGEEKSHLCEVVE